MTFNKKLLSIAVCTVVSGVATQGVWAQEQQQQTDAPMEEIVVQGLRQSLDTAQAIKRMGDTVKDVITASDIGALPDKSVTEALQRVPGVTIEHFASSDDPNHYADEGTGVLVRGLDRVRSEINGRDSFSANRNGGLNFEDIPPELLGSVEVIKNQTADMIAGGIAGTVNLVTRKPFDSEGRVFGATVKGNYGDFRHEWTPTVSALFSDRWETGAGEFGFLLSASQSEYKTRGDGIGVANFYSHGDSFEGEYDQWGGVVGVQPGSPVDAPAIEGQEAGTVVWVPNQFSIRRAENDRERTGLASSLQWRNNNKTVEATLEYIRSDASLEYRENVIGTQGQGFNWATKSTATVLEDDHHPYTFEDGFFTSGIIAPGTNLPMMSSARYNETDNQVEDLSFNLTLTPSDRLTMSFDVQQVEASSRVENNGINAYHQGPERLGSAFLDLRGDYPKLEFVDQRFIHPEKDAYSAWDGYREDMYFRSALDQDVASDGEEIAAKFDVEYTFDHDWARGVEAGVYYSDKDLDIRDTEYSNWGAIARTWVTEDMQLAGYHANKDEFERVYFDEFFGGHTLRNSNAFLFPKMSSAENFLEFTRRGCEEGFSTAPYGGIPGGNEAQTNPECFLAQEDLGDRIEGTVFAPHHVTTTNEKRAEAYARFNFAFDDVSVPVRGNLGLRYVSYQLESTGFTVFPQKPTGNGSELFEQMYSGLADFSDGTGQVLSVDGTDYDTILPSLNLVFGLTEDWLVRFGASQGVYFPEMRDTRASRILSLRQTTVLEDPTQPYDEQTNPVVDIRDVQLNGIARNPYLEPEEAVSLDLTSEWYFSDVGSLIFSFFHKQLDNVIQERTFFQEVTNPNSGVTQQVSFAGPANTGSGDIQGFEVAYTQFFDALPGAWSGLGVQLNYTYIDQKNLADEQSDEGKGELRFDAAGNPISDGRNSFRSFTNLPLPSYSDESYNIVGMYEYGDISARVAYNWRSDYLVTRRDSNEFVPIYSKDVGYMDASFYYAINDNVKVGIEASNLLDTITETQAQFNQEGRRTDALNFKTDRRYALSLRMSF